MSRLSQLLKNITNALAVSPADKEQMHKDIEAIEPAAFSSVAAGSPVPVERSIVSLLSDLGNTVEARLMNYVEKRLSGVPIQAAIPPVLTVPAGVDPTLISAAPPAVVEPVAAPVVVEATPAPDPTPATVEFVADPNPQVANSAGNPDFEAAAPVVSDPTPEPAVADDVPAIPVVTDDDAAKQNWRTLGYTFDPVTGAPL